MFLKVKGKKISIVELKSWKERFKSFKFYLETIDYGLKFPNKKFVSTIFYCQRVDIVFTDKDDRIIYIFNDVGSERTIFKFKSKNVYVLPLNTGEKLKVGEVMPLRKEKD